MTDDNSGAHCSLGCAAGTSTGPNTPVSVGNACTQCSQGFGTDPTNEGVGQPCIPCPTGYFADNSTGKCLPCGENTYNSDVGATACTPCPPNHTSPTGSNYSDACTPCYAGFTIDTHSSADGCNVQCQPGTSTGPGTTSPLGGECAPCAPGFFTNMLLTSGYGQPCEACTDGQAFLTPGQVGYPSSDCGLCQAGYYALGAECSGDGSGSGSGSGVVCSGGVCTECPIGFFTGGGANVASCTPCPFGTTTGVSGATTSSACVVPCDAGNSTGPGTVGGPESGTCSACSAGFFTDTSSGSSDSGQPCISCPNGTALLPGNTAAVLNSSAACGQCGAGNYVLDGVCTACPVGSFFAGGANVDACTQCPPNTYNASTGAASCTACPANYISAAGSGSSGACMACASGQLAILGVNTCYTPQASASPSSPWFLAFILLLVVAVAAILILMKRKNPA